MLGDPCYVDWSRREKQSDDKKLWSSYPIWIILAGIDQMMIIYGSEDNV